MTIDEAIRHCEEVAKSCQLKAYNIERDDYKDLEECADDHRQLAEWLTDYQKIKTKQKYGKWIKAPGSWCTPGGDPVWCCSECGKGIHVYGVEHGTYGADIADHQWVSCPNCGACMEGSEW